MGRLDGKVALITGAASGMGKVAATLFASEGARVVVADVTDDAGQATSEEIEADGGQAAYVHADVSNPREAEAMVGDIHRAVGSDGEAVGAAAVLRHDLLTTVGLHPHDRPAQQLHAQHAVVGHPYRALGEPQTARDLGDLLAHARRAKHCLTDRSRASWMAPMKLRMEPSDEYMHPLESATNFNESMYFNFFDPAERIGGWVRDRKSVV